MQELEMLKNSLTQQIQSRLNELYAQGHIDIDMQIPSGILGMLVLEDFNVIQIEVGDKEKLRVTRKNNATKSNPKLLLG